MKKIFCCLLIFFTYSAVAQNVSPNFGWPVNTVNESNNRGEITGTPSEYRSPYTGGNAVIFGVTISGHRYHQGIDIANSHGQNVYSIEDNNSIVEIEGSSSSGNRRIRIGNTVYWHVDENPILFDGATVDKNDVIGTTNAGNLAPHLHIQPSPSTIFGSANFLTYKFNNYQDCSIPNFDSNSSGELIIEFYENGHSKINGLSNEMNQHINGSNLIFGNIDLVVGVNDERTLPDCNGANDGGNLGINKIHFKIKNENEIFHENSQIDFSNLPNYESAGHINGHYSSSSNHRYVVTNDPFNMPYDKYLNTKKKNNSGEIFNPDDLSQYALFNLESIIPDNIYNLEITVSDIDSDSENENFNSSSILIDNFLPYIQKVTLSDSEGVFYEGEWTLNNSDTALEFEQCTFRNGISTGFNVQIETSETMNNLSMNLAGVTNNLISTNNEKTVWELQNPYTGNASSNQTITFTGSDTAGNPLLTDPSILYYRINDTGNNSDDWSPSNPITGADTIHKINMSVNCSDMCSNIYEPNNSQSDAFLFSSIGKDFSNYANLEACLSYNLIYEDWYLIGATAQGKLNITLTNQTDDFEIELYNGGSNTPFEQGTAQSNGDIALEWCSINNACVPLYIRVFKDQNSTPSTNPNFNYNLILDWDYNQSCNTSGRQVNSNSSQNNNLTITGDTNICVGESTTLTVNGGTGNYQWFLNGNEIGTGSSINLNNLSAGNNLINVVDMNSACNAGSATIVVTQDVTANAGSNVTIQNGSSTTLQGSGSTNCSWSPTTGLSNPNSCTTTASPTQTTTYTLTVTENGCTDTDTVTVTVDGSGGGNPPANDDCNDAITLISSTSCNYTNGTVEDATPSFGANNCLGCSCTSPDDYDVYYKFTAVETSHTVTVSNYASNFDAVIELRTACSSGSSNYISCYDPTGAPTSVSETWTGLTIGQTYYIRVFEWGYQQSPPNSNTFDICVTHQNSNSDGIDLISDITSVSDDNPDSGDTITINYTGSNIGDEPTTTLPTISFFLSTNTTLSGSDDYLDIDIILQTIAVNETVNGDIEVTLPNIADGQYYLVSSIDHIELINEANDDNNINFYAIQIGDVVPNGSDLDVRDVDVIPNSSLIPGQEVDIEVRIENEGTEDVGSFEVLVYFDINGDNEYDGGNEYMGEFTFNSLDAGDDETMTVDFDLPTAIYTAGNYEIFAIADSDNTINETDENNNDDDQNVTIGYVYDGVNDDVRVIDETINITNVNAGSDVFVTSNHIYLGSQPDSNVPTLDLGYYLSTDCVLSTDDIFLDDDSSGIGNDDPIKSEDQTLTIPIATPSGTYYILFVADNENEVAEGGLENNNVVCIQITVNNTNTANGDVYITDEVCNPIDVMIGNEIEPYANIHYTGTLTSAELPNVAVYYYLSNDCVLSTDDILVSDDNISLGSDLPINDASDEIQLPNDLTPGTYYIIFRADAENDVFESDENNNTACVQFNLVPADANYQDVTFNSPYVAVNEAELGQQIYASIHQNYTGYQSDADLSNIRMEYYLSSDCTLSADDYYFTSDVSSLGYDDPSQFEYANLTIPSTISVGDYYILFVADTENIIVENNEANNTACVPITIVDSTLTIDDNKLNEKIKVYPNPVNDILTVNLGEVHSKINIEIYNIIGQRINSLKFENEQIILVNTTYLSNGIYFFKIHTDTINSVEFKIIKE